MATSHRCDHCRATIDTSSDAAMIVNVHRRVDDDEWGDSWFSDSAKDTFRFCSQPHLAAYMGRETLPPPVRGDDGDEGSVATVLGCLLVGLVVVALLVGAGYGFLALVTDVL
ncbi:hypothetical protein ASD11_05470 [Aeromicrobium sp. Root495]|uniref:hypothetical protein n=1 Tax=Aeromicrobium sp. Root495 TaxID=1736550 RepID=UPI0006FB6DD9|nr:hypothetical protein [Aeromicrobium sp. Root495]KQY59057.1 hypothetical protein ASD11_05470 [Aeromicrobium sp. Root495]